MGGRTRLALVAALLVATIVGSLLAGRAGDAQDPVVSEPPYSSGQTLTEPPVINSSDGFLRTTLVARNGTVTVSGVRVGNTQTYAADESQRALLGPTLHVQPGDTIDLVLDNQLTPPATVTRPDSPPNSTTPDKSCPPADDPMMHHEMEPLPPGGQLTNLHYHGLRVTPTTRKFQGMDVFGDNVLLNLGPGPSHFRFNIPKHHDQGTFWYHAHRHGCTDDQVFRGLAGVLLIGDSRLTLPRRFRHVRERTLALKDIQAVPDVSDVTGAPWAIPSDHDWAHPTQRTVNGQVQPDIPIQPGETQLWRVANISAAVWYRIAVEDGDRRLPYTVVARDGNPMSRPEQRGAALLGPGHRLDIIVTAPAGGSLALKTLPFDQGRLTFPEETLATATPAGTPAKSRSVDRRRKPLPHFPPVVRTRHFDFSFNRRKGYKKDPAAFAFINGTPFDPDHTNVKPRLGTTERWVLTNSSTEWHPFHIHQNDFRVISVNGRRIKHPAGDQDVVPLPPMRANGKPGRVVILMPFTKFKGRFVFHCHILDHEDGGMMKLVVVR